jgi:large subunit ribosomal protein L21
MSLEISESGEGGVEAIKMVVAGSTRDYRKTLSCWPCCRRQAFLTSSPTLSEGPAALQGPKVCAKLEISAKIAGSVEIRPWNNYSKCFGTRVKEVNMYAVIKTGGKQYRVASGEKIKVEQIAADVGQEIVIDQVLAVGNGAELKVGTPLVSGATVKATVVAHGKHDKVHIFKMRRRKHYQKRQGHRQQFTELQIGDIAG